MSGLTSVGRRLVRIFGPDPRAIAQSAAALLVSIVATLIAGLTLASSEERLGQLPGLLLLVPAAIAQRGNVFGALGSRLGTGDTHWRVLSYPAHRHGVWPKRVGVDGAQHGRCNLDSDHWMATRATLWRCWSDESSCLLYTSPSPRDS